MLISLSKALSVASAAPDLRLPSQPPIGWYQIILLGDRGTCVLTTSPGLHSTAGGQDLNPRPVDRKSSVLTTRHRATQITRPNTVSNNQMAFWVLLKQRTMEVVVTTGAISRAKLQSNHLHQQQTNIKFSYRPDALPVTQPTT